MCFKIPFQYMLQYSVLLNVEQYVEVWFQEGTMFFMWYSTSLYPLSVAIRICSLSSTRTVVGDLK